MERMKKPAVILGILGCISAIISIIGCVMLGINKEVIFLLLAIALFIVTAYLKNDIIVYISYGFYLLTLYFFVSDELFYISNEIQGIDSAGLSAGFILGAGGLILAILFSMAGSICSFKN